MKVQVSIPDEVFEEYVKKFGIPACYSHMKRAITEFKDVDKNDRYLMIAGDGRRELEKVFQTTVDDAKKLARLVKNMCTVKIGGVEHSFTSDELARLQAQAGFYGKSLEDYIKDQIAEISQRMLEQV